MYFLNFVRSLWFFRAGGIPPSQLEVSASASYNVTCSIYPVTSVDVSLSAFAYKISASTNADLVVDIDATGDIGDSLDLILTITPVYVLDIAGQVDQSTSAAYKLSATFSATIQPQIAVTGTYGISCSASIVKLIIDEVSVDATYKISASSETVLVISQDNIALNVNANYGISASADIALVTPPPGGLVFSRTKKRYIPVGIGS